METESVCQRTFFNNKAVRFFTEKPKGNIWKRTTIYLILLKYISPLVLLISFPLLIGLVAPNQAMDFSDTSESLVNVFTTSMEALYEVGSNIAITNPILSKVIFLIIANLVYVVYAGILFLIIDIIRYIISFIYSHNKEKVRTK